MMRLMLIATRLILGLAGAMAAQSVTAASPPFQPAEIAIAARDQQIESFLGDFYGKAGMPVQVSGQVTGKINGAWRGPPGLIWRELVKAFNILAHYDGAIVRIYSATEVTSRTIPSLAPGDVVKQVAKLNLGDANNIVKAGTSSVIATGVPMFVDQVAKIAASARASVVASPPVRPLPTPDGPLGTKAALPGIVSPRLTPVGGISGGIASSPRLRSVVLDPASARFPYEVRIFYLRYAKADDTVILADGLRTVRRGAASVLRGVMGDGRQSETVTQSSSGNQDTAYRSTRDGSREVSGVGDGIDNGGRDSGSDARDVNGPRIEVDVSNNAVIVRDRPEAMGTYEGILRGIDVEPRIIEIEATIIELDITRLKRLGLDISFTSNRLGALFGGQPIQGNTTGSDFSASFLTGAGGLFQARIDALEQNGSLRVTQRPRIIAINNQESVFDNQTRFNTRVSGERDARLFEIRYGIVLRVTPSVIGDMGELRTRLSVVVQDGKFAGFNVDGIPARNDSNLSTETIIKQGESLLIGGMTIDSEIESRSKTPGVGDIPVVGNVFKKRRSTSQHLERLILITPRVIDLSDGKQPTTLPSSVSTPIPLEQLRGKTLPKSQKLRANDGPLPVTSR